MSAVARIVDALLRRRGRADRRIAFIDQPGPAPSRTIGAGWGAVVDGVAVGAGRGGLADARRGRIERADIRPGATPGRVETVAHMRSARH